MIHELQNFIYNPFNFQNSMYYPLNFPKEKKNETIYITTKLDKGCVYEPLITFKLTFNLYFFHIKSSFDSIILEILQGWDDNHSFFILSST